MVALESLKELAKFPYIVKEIGGWEKAYNQLTMLRFRAKDSLFTPKAQELFEEVVALCRNTQYAHLSAYKRSASARSPTKPLGLDNVPGEDNDVFTSNPIMSLAAAKARSTRAAEFTRLSLERQAPKESKWKSHVLCAAPGLTFYAITLTTFTLNVALLVAGGYGYSTVNVSLGICPRLSSSPVLIAAYPPQSCAQLLEPYALFSGLLGLFNNAWTIGLFIIYLHKENRYTQPSHPHDSLSF